MSRDRGTPVPKGNQLSEGLKARLKRCGQYHSSPLDSCKLSKQACLTLKESILKQPDGPGSDIVTMVTDKVIKDRFIETSLLQQHSLAEISTLGDGLTIESKTLERERSNEKDFENVCDNSQVIVNPGSSHYSELAILHTPEVNRNTKNGEERHSTTCATKNTKRGHHSTPCVPRITRRFETLRCEKLELSGSDIVKQKPVSNSENTCITMVDTSRVKTITKSSTETLCTTSCELKPDVCSIEGLLKQKEQLKEMLKSKEETLRKLNLVKMYRSKNDLDYLASVTDKWLDVSQQALKDLQQLMPEPKPSLTELINHLQIDHTLIRFSSEEEDFMI